MTTKQSWSERFDEYLPDRQWLPDGYGFNSESEVNEFGYKVFVSATKAIYEVTDWGHVKKFVETIVAEERAKVAEEATIEIDKLYYNTEHADPEGVYAEGFTDGVSASKQTLKSLLSPHHQ